MKTEAKKARRREARSAQTKNTRRELSEAEAREKAKRADDLQRKRDQQAREREEALRREVQEDDGDTSAIAPRPVQRSFSALSLRSIARPYDSKAVMLGIRGPLERPRTVPSAEMKRWIGSRRSSSKTWRHGVGSR